MPESREVINQALDLAAAGAIDDACQKLWPLVRDTDGREEALFTMACCFEKANQLPPAAYIFGWVAERYPDFIPATERVDRCRRQMAERGLHEDFSDSGHVACSACTLRYRAELPLCPYCGGQLAPSSVAIVAPPLPEEPRSRELLDEIGADLDRAWKSVQQRFNEFTERSDLSGTALRVQELAREARERARIIAESEAAKQVKHTVSGLGEEAARRARAIAQNESVKSLARQSRDLGEEAIARVKAVASREETKDAWERVEDLGKDTADRVEEWAKRDDVRSTWRNVYAKVEGVVANLQRRVDRITGRKPEESPPAPESQEPPTKQE